MIKGEADLKTLPFCVLGHLPDLHVFRHPHSEPWLGSLAYWRKTALEKDGFSDVEQKDDDHKKEYCNGQLDLTDDKKKFFLELMASNTSAKEFLNEQKIWGKSSSLSMLSILLLDPDW